MLEKINQTHSNRIKELLIQKRDKLKQELPMLPETLLDDQAIQKYVKRIVTAETGFISESGFIHIIFVENLFYGRYGVYTPEWGYVLSGNRRQDQELLNETYNVMKKKGYKDHAISVFTKDETIIDHLFDSCYGSRCMDAHTVIEAPEVPCELTFEKAELSDKASLVPIIDEHQRYMNDVPSLLGFTYAQAEMAFKEILEVPNGELFKILLEDQIIGVTHLVKGNSGGCELSTDGSTMAVRTTHFLEAYRGRGLMNDVIAFYHQYAQTKACNRLSVDYETMNPSANGCWPKFFTPTIRSLVRYIG